MFDSLPGFREFYPEDFAKRLGLFDSWRRSLEICGYQEYDAAVLEPLELFTEKSGDEIVEQLFHFTDKGDRRVALRPEMTPTLARMVGAKANALRRPIKWFHIGDHFRYERMQKGRTRCFTQLNADILGDDSAMADVEAIYSLIQVCRHLGLTAEQFVVRLSDRNIWWLALQTFGVSEAVVPGLLAVIDKVERMPEEKSLAALEELMPGQSAEMYQMIKSLFKVQNLEELTQWFLSKDGCRDEIRERVEQRVREWRFLWEQLQLLGCEAYLKMDFTIVRGLAYYTGFVFEAFEKGRKARSLAGGGRYDHLIEKLGGSPMPAVGWGMGDVTLTDCLKHYELLPTHEDPDRVFLVFESSTRQQALQWIHLLRHAGICVMYSFKEDVGFGKQLKEATQSRCRYALICGETEVRLNQMLLRNLEDRSEESISFKEIESVLVSRCVR